MVFHWIDHIRRVAPIPGRRRGAVRRESVVGFRGRRRSRESEQLLTVLFVGDIGLVVELEAERVLAVRVAL